MKSIILHQQPHSIKTMATIESLDLATLTNNPQSIAEALEDALEVTSGNIGQLKTDAQSAKDDIDDLLTQAQTNANTIAALVGSSSITHYSYSDMNISANSPWVFNTNANNYAFEFQDIVFFQLTGDDNNSLTLSDTSNYEIGTIGNTALRPSGERRVFSPSINYDSESASHFIIYSDGKIKIAYPNELGDGYFRFSIQGFYKL